MTDKPSPAAEEVADAVDEANAVDAVDGEDGEDGEDGAQEQAQAQAEAPDAADNAASVEAAPDADADAEGREAEPEDDPAAEPLVVQCPQCAVPVDAQSLCCPSCHEDLVALVRLRYAGRIAFNDALGLLRAGRREAAEVALERAVAAEPGLAAAERLLAALRAAGTAPVAAPA